MEIVNYFLKVVKDYKNFSGRARRKEFWMYALAYFILSIIVGVVANMINFPFLTTILTLVLLVPSIAVGVRRMHDVGKSGWFILIPFYNIYLCVIEGDKGSNEYGTDPKA